MDIENGVREGTDSRVDTEQPSNGYERFPEHLDELNEEDFGENVKNNGIFIV